MAAAKNGKKDLEYYLNLHWTYTVERTRDNGDTSYIVCVQELPGVCSEASTVEEGMELLRDELEVALIESLEAGEEIPEPEEEEYD